MQHTIEALIFDLDGVIVDTARYHFQSWKSFASKYGFDIPEILNERLKGVSRMEALEIVMHYAPKSLQVPERYPDFAAEKNSMYLAMLDNLSQDEILPGVETFLRDARALGLRLALGSGSKNASAILDHLGIVPLFDVICDGNDIQRSKPDPQVFLLAAEKLGVQPQHAVVFEDAEVGIEAAIRAGMLPVGVGDPDLLPGAATVIDGFAYIHAAEFIRSLQALSVS